MARVGFWQFVVDEQGRPIENAIIRFYLSDNPAQEADIFTHASLGVPTTTSAVNMKTDGNGFFEFWLGDEFEDIGGYISTQKFKLTWERAGILLGSISNIDVFPPVFKVNELDNTSSTKSDKNKLISNELAYKWDTHVDSDISEEPHDFEPVDNTSQDETYNKLVSNSLMNYILSAIASAGTLSIDASGAIERNFTITSWIATSAGYYTVLNHFLGRAYPVLQVYKSSDGFQYNPLDVEVIDINSLKLWVSDNINTEVVVIG